MSARLAPVLDFVLTNTPPPEFNPDTVTPGPWGFFAIFFVAVVTLLLAMDLARRIRRTNYRADVQERLQAEILERDELAAQKAQNSHGTETAQGTEKVETTDKPDAP